MTYRQIGPDDGSHGACLVARQQGRFMCDAVNHSSKNGCPNPACWLYRPGAPDGEPSREERYRAAR